MKQFSYFWREVLSFVVEVGVEVEVEIVLVVEEAWRQECRLVDYA